MNIDVSQAPEIDLDKIDILKKMFNKKSKAKIFFKPISGRLHLQIYPEKPFTGFVDVTYATKIFSSNIQRKHFSENPPF